MKVKDLLAKLAMVDQELDVAISSGEHEYWGQMYAIASGAYTSDIQVDGPKRPSRLVLLITEEE